MFAENQDKANKTKKVPQFLSKDKLDQLGAEGDHDEDIEQGVKIMPFNMDDELDEGAFDENFNYVRTRDQHEVHDKWLDGINNKYIQLAKVASDRIKRVSKLLTRWRRTLKMNLRAGRSLEEYEAESLLLRPSSG
ncbi:hypothetical protein BCR33DRAFT_131360 [Rhizoclosmatium globosum]|uniref:Uncharacterized protein n=1 Tax=Rhizoclosmatium globosum TaxID=329046 RepID=A0A1Y2CHR2_9FUNG|nr:hypothetical protein BCR33DRAFT_131360 [Rhizoclosmatium globosum]|eukprot:ORY46578.1 hypothetical protein BCR33DRAFT_131360 [Rhizoclosmatium globosum]